MLFCIILDSGFLVVIKILKMLASLAPVYYISDISAYIYQKTRGKALSMILNGWIKCEKWHVVDLSGIKRCNFMMEDIIIPIAYAFFSGNVEAMFGLHPLNWLFLRRTS